MGALFSLLYLLLFIFTLLLFARLVVEWIAVYSRTFRPRGMIAVLVEAVFTITDPPVNAVRKVLPPLRLGAVSLDLSLMVVLIACSFAMRICAALAASL